jgi:murein DD-endopeptidase MepM/ murein hydrolase activator NlpD
VKIGQWIARVGMSGTNADQPQMFFEVLQGRKPVNPMGLLPKRSGRIVDVDDDDGQNSE